MINTSRDIQKRFDAVSRSSTFRNILSKLRLNEMSVLDLGCCYGEHLSHFGPASTGLTISAEEAAEGQRRGLDIKVGDAEQLAALERTFDAVYCSNLLEHLEAPHRFLAALRNALKPGGTLVLGVPVLPFPHALMQLTKFRGALASNHINFFTGASLRLTVARAGWRIKEVRGFHFKNRFFDWLAYPLYPHLYVIAAPDPKFEYSQKRRVELAGRDH